MAGERLFSPAQMRAARALLDWPADRLAAAAGLEPEAVELFEQGEGDLAANELARLAVALHRAGVIAIPERWAGVGVRFRDGRRG
jgi:hypothetical protein